MLPDMKRNPPPLATGYRLTVSAIPHDEGQAPKTRFTLETEQLFASFVYDLSVEEKRDAQHIQFRILGLKPPQLSIPSAGRASFEREYDNLSGPFHVTIENLDGRKNTFKLKVTKDKVTVLQSPREKFIDLVL